MMKRRFSVVTFVLVFALALMMCSAANADVVNVHAWETVTVTASSQVAVIDHVTVENTTIATAEVTNVSFVQIGSWVTCSAGVEVTGINPGTTTMSFYDESGDFIFSGTIVVEDHTWGDGEVVEEPTCTEQGLKSYVCTVCGSILGEYIPTIDHDDGAWRIDKEPTCIEAGSKGKHCTMCDLLLETESIPATGHDDGAWKTVKEAGCTSDGTKELRCTKCDALLETQAIPATGHTPGEWEVTAKVTCNKNGVKEKKCIVCQTALEKEEIPSAGTEHTPGDWKTVKEPTCVAEGEKQKACTICGEVTASEAVPALGHAAGEMAQTKAPTCADTGLKEQHCTVCGELLNSESIAALGHAPGEWVTVKKTTREETGEKQQACTVCGQVLQTEEIPMITRTKYASMTCSIGPRFRDVSDITDEWDMFSAIDISQDGVQEYELIAGNIHIVGTAKVTVENGFVTVTYEVLKGVTVKSEFLSILPSLSSIQEWNRDAMKTYAFGEPISIADDLGGDTKVLLYIHNRLGYYDDIAGLRRLWHTSKMYKNCVEEMKALMD